MENGIRANEKMKPERGTELLAVWPLSFIPSDYRNVKNDR